MHARKTQTTLLGLVCFALATVGLEAQKAKPVSLPDIPGEAVFRCAGPANAISDAVCGDGSDQYIDQSLGGDQGVQVSLREGDHQFRLRFDPLGLPARHLTAFVPDRLLPLHSNECTSNCLAANAGGAPISNTAVTVEVRDGQDGRIQTTMRDARNNTIVGGPTTLTVGQSAPIDVLIGFEDPHGRGYRWALYWSPINYPGSTPAAITRTGVCTWTVEAVPGQIVGLRLFNTGSGKNNTRYEGRFDMPFSLTFTADPGSMPNGC